jgi:hypothetical protein
MVAPRDFAKVQELHHLGFRKIDEDKLFFNIARYTAEGNNNFEKCKYSQALSNYESCLILSGPSYDDEDLDEIVHNA